MAWYVGAAVAFVVLARNVCAGACDSVKDSAGAVVGLATEVVNSGDRLPALKLETVPAVPTEQVGQEMVAMPLAVLTTIGLVPAAWRTPLFEMTGLLDVPPMM